MSHNRYIYLTIDIAYIMSGGAWNRDLNAKCIDINLLTYGAGGIAVGLDLIILLLPIRDLVKLNMSRRKKVHVLLMFSVGSM